VFFCRKSIGLKVFIPPAGGVEQVLCNEFVCHCQQRVFHPGSIERAFRQLIYHRRGDDFFGEKSGGIWFSVESFLLIKTFK
jgi:hypothetical protein